MTKGRRRRDNKACDAGHRRRTLAESALGDKKAILHKGHGAFVVGGSVEETLFRTISLEKAAKTQVYAAIMGELSPIPVESMTEREKHPDDHIVDDFFGYYSGKMEKLERQAQA